MEFIKKYKEYFMSNRELWLANLKNIEEYIIKNNNLPSQYNKHNKIKILHSWLATQQSNYKNNEYIMKNENIRKVYMEFIKKHKEYFMSNNESWLDKLKSIEEYIVKNNKLPSSSDNIPEIKYLGKWIGTQKINYKNNKNIMKNENIKKIWKEFIVKHKDYFLSNLESWLDKLKNIEEYIIKNNKLPSQYDINIETKSLCSWLSNQKQNYKNNKDIMKNNNNRKSWKTFTEKYKEYFD
jgi:hypothetical protein